MADGDRVGTTAKAAGRRVSGPVHAVPPPPVQPAVHERPPSRPFRAGPARAASAAAETQRESVGRQSAGSFLLKRDTALTIPFPYSGSINQPTVGGQGDAILQAGNWYAAASTDNGGSFRFISPYETFPAAPFSFSGGFCCDQRVTQDPTRDLVVWVLSYLPTGRGPTDTNGIRLAIAHGAADVGSNTWDVHDLTPADFGFSLGTWLDYPQVEVSANYLYLTANVFDTGNFFQIGTVIGRIPLAALSSNSPYTLDAFSTVQFADVSPVSGATTAMYFGSVTGTGTIGVVAWPETAIVPTRATVGGLAFTAGGQFSCPGPDGLDPGGRGLARMQTGWITPTELGFMWHSGQGFGRPYPFVRSVILNPATLAVIAEPDIWSNARAYLYPYVAVNARGHLGGQVSALGGDTMPAMNALIRDSLSPNVVTSGWELHEVGASTHGTAGRWGDYAGAVTHEKYPNTWLAGGHLQEGGSADGDSRPHNLWFMREQDDPGGPAFGTPTPTRTASATPGPPTSTRTPSPTATVTRTPSPTPIPVGGRGFTLQSGSGGIRLSWQPGQGQSGYVIARLGSLPAVLPLAGPLPADATGAQDLTGSLLGGTVCYVLVPTGVTPPVVSDLLCAAPNTHSAVGGPQVVSIRLNQSNTATLGWTAPAFGAPTGYLVYTLGDTLATPMLLSANATGASIPISGATCFLVLALTGTTATGTSDVVCAVPGAATRAASSPATIAPSTSRNS